ncbi:carbon-nitrogen hydrolase family protein [Neorhizobium sp. AL 9.2.2]|uniref:carbon-nitrogen hydrolase family protein n=1 Tax=Neorhizobium sp. AL 9.2.2 TaxID=2712894 RepID=UPI0013AF6382|nr:carbon-nitrogen hydrolase family protein [Neorhizobium sp. AL 9.2.2]NSY18457.1 carbon-nitrogen hydrolase family protein [Neorhizobium sp. AL 9.2.2]
MKVKLAAAHAASVLLDKQASIAKAADLIAKAGQQDVSLLCFPETFVPGFPYWINLYPPGDQHGIHLRYLSQSVDLVGDDLAPVCEAAAKAGVFVVLGISERDGATMYNAQVFIGKDGRIVGKHRKLQPTFAERMLWGQGDGSTLQVFDTPVGRVGGLICYEHMLNLARQALIDQRMQIHCASWPTFAPLVGRGAAYDMTVDAIMRAHAITGQCFVVVAQNPVTQDYLETIEKALGPQAVLKVGGGSSTIYGPNGMTLAGPHVGLEEKLITAEVDLDQILGAKVLADTAGHYARPEILHLTVDRRVQRNLHEIREEVMKP